MTSASHRSLKVLLTNVWLQRRGGTETVIRDISLGLLRRGHRPIVYSPVLGSPASELRERGVAVISDLSLITDPPDVIHGQHFIQTAEALIHFPEVPAVQMCHGWAFWQEKPADFPQIHRYIAVDQAVHDRLVHSEGIDKKRVEILHNSIDLSRYIPRPVPLPAKPLKALAFTKYQAHVPMLEAVCRKFGMQLEVIGVGDKVIAHPEFELIKYDVVFATARMALEALCAGCAVIVLDARGLGGMVTSTNLARLRDLNFGLRSLSPMLTQGLISVEIELYDPDDARQVSDRVRQMASLEPMLDRLMGIYDEAIARPLPDERERAQALFKFLKISLPNPRANDRWPWIKERQDLELRVSQLEEELAQAKISLSAVNDAQLDV